VLLESLNDTKGKKILIIGNGISSKELFLLYLGAEIVYTDLSIQAVMFMKDEFLSSEFYELGFKKIEFHAVDALHLPFPTEEFDIIYGYLFVHHLEDIEQFLMEVNRCLKKNGMCRFFDEAYSPVWQLFKNKLFKPLQLYTHKKSGISPEDLRATRRGGFKEEEIYKLKQKLKFKSVVFIRMSFFHHLFARGVGKIFGNYRPVNRCLRLCIDIMHWLDKYLGDKSAFARNNFITLIWGFDK